MISERFTARVPPLSREDIRAKAEQVLRASAPELLERPAPLPVGEFAAGSLERYGINFVPAELPVLVEAQAKEGPGRPGPWAIIELPGSAYRRLRGHGEVFPRLRATVAHELGHAVLHVRQAAERRRRGLPALDVAPALEVPFFENAEWQAWCFAGCLCAPPAVLAPLVERGEDLRQLADTFGISRSFTRQHLERYGLEVKDMEMDRQLALQGL